MFTQHTHVPISTQSAKRSKAREKEHLTQLQTKIDQVTAESETLAAKTRRLEQESERLSESPTPALLYKPRSVPTHLHPVDL